MATVALAVALPALVGSATAATTIIGGLTVGGLLATTGALAGSFIDQAFVFPAIFGGQHFEGPRVDDLRVQTASEGVGLAIVYGIANRVPGRIIVASDLIEIKKNESVGGKGGGTQSSFHYHVHVAIAWCEGPVPVDGITKIWANSKIIWEIPEPISIEDTDDVLTIRKGVRIGGTFSMHVRAPDAGPDLSGLQPGTDATIANCTNAGNNGTFRVHQSKFLGVAAIQTVTIDDAAPNGYMFRLSFNGQLTGWIRKTYDEQAFKNALVEAPNIEREDMNVALIQASGPKTWRITFTKGGAYGHGPQPDFVVEHDPDLYINVTTTQAGTNASKVILLNNGVVNEDATDTPGAPHWTIDQTPVGQSVGKMNSLTNYWGDDIQLPDAFLEGFFGTQPAYRGTCYTVIERLALGEHGNVIPQFTALVKGEKLLLSDVITDLVERAAGSEIAIDVSALDAITVGGYAIVGPQVTAQAVEKLMVAYDLGAQESAGTIRFVHRGDEETVTIVASDLAATEGRPVDALKLTDVADFDLPSEVNVRYLDEDLDWQSGSQRERRINSVTDGVLEIDMPLVFTACEARDIAARLLYEPWATRQGAELTLPPKYMTTQEGDLLSITYTPADGAENTYVIRATKVTRGGNQMIAIEGIIEDRPVFDHNSPCDEPQRLDPPGLYLPPETIIIVVDMPALRSGDETAFGYYAVVCAADPEATWRGAGIYRNRTGSSEQELVDSAATEAAIGEVQDNEALGSATGRYWDRNSTLTVEMLEGELSSASSIEVYNGANRMLVRTQDGETELIAFQTATLVSEGIYTISNLLRGLRHTHGVIDSHDPAEPGQVVLLDAADVHFIGANLTDRGVEHEFAAVPSEGVVDTWPIGAVLTPDFNNQKPFSPCRVRGTRDGSNNLTISWTRRSRAICRIFGTEDVPLLEGFERYEVDIENPAIPGAVIRTLAVEDVTEATYSAANQTTDGYTPGDPITILGIYQIDSVVGRGYPTEEMTL